MQFARGHAILALPVQNARQWEWPVTAEIVHLNLQSLCQPPGMPAVSVSAGTYFTEAAAVCLEQKHSPGASLSVKGIATRQYLLVWPPADDQQRNTHADSQDATEHGACAIAFVLCRELTGYKAVQQSRKSTGFDYWLGNEGPELFCARLEISGILEGSDTDINSRVKKKKKQTKQSESTGLPAYACIVEFGRPEAHFVQA